MLTDQALPLIGFVFPATGSTWRNLMPSALTQLFPLSMPYCPSWQSSGLLFRSVSMAGVKSQFSQSEALFHAPLLQPTPAIICEFTMHRIPFYTPIVIHKINKTIANTIRFANITDIVGKKNCNHLGQICVFG